MAGSSLHLRAVQTTVRPCQARPCAPFTSVRPHRSRCCAPVQAVAPPFNYTQLKQQTTSIGELRLLSTAAPVAVPFYLVTCSPAAAAEDTAFNAAAQSSGSTDLIVSVLAALVFGLLLVVTGGVLYLNLKSWLDGRQETEDRKAPAVVSSAQAAPSSSSDEDDAPRRTRAVRDKSKGFSRK